MLFNTKDFALFFAIVLAAYWLLFKWRTLQNMIVLAASMYFYAQLHYSFPIYLSALIIISYGFALAVERSEHAGQRKALLVVGLCIISAGLVETKYLAFVINQLNSRNWVPGSWSLIAPVGISFYTFSTLGYLTDVYRRKITAEKNLLTYATYISFFPHLLSGPIPAAQTVLPQFSRKASITLVGIDESIGEIVWGLFKKMVIADNISLAVSYCFSQYSELTGSTLIIGVVLFGVQLYADFSGYSSMAKGFAGLLGIELIQNFNLPFSSKSLTEYWRRWHISLTNWFYEYIFNPTVVACRDWGKGAIVFALMLTFFISGFWHGAGWQFVIWGLLHGIVMSYEALTSKRRKKKAKQRPLLYSLLSHVFVLLFLCFAWVFFRAASVHDAFVILSRIGSSSIIAAPEQYVLKYTVWCLPLFIVEWIQRKGTYIMDMQQWQIGERLSAANAKQINIAVKLVLYVLVCIAIFCFYKKVNAAEYYYFKF